MTPNRGRIISEAEFRRMWTDRSLRVEDIGARLGITSGAVSVRARLRGFLPRAQIGCTHLKAPIDSAEFTELWCAMVKTEHIARHFGVSHRTVNITSMRLGLPERDTKGRITMRQFREAAPCH